MAVDDALGVACGAGGEGDQCRAGGVGGEGAVQRFGVEQVVVTVLMLLARALVGAHQSDDRDVGAEVGLELHAPELFGRDEDARLGRAEDVAEFLAPVEVHDRHGHGAQERRRPERRGGLHPVR